VGECRCTRDL